jgi:hypothetical protein
MMEVTMAEEFWVIGGRYRDVSFRDIEEGSMEAYGPFPRYEDALSSWSSHSARTSSLASVRYSVVVTAKNVSRRSTA